MKRFVRREKTEIERTYSDSESNSERVSGNENWRFSFAKKRQ